MVDTLTSEPFRVDHRGRGAVSVRFGAPDERPIGAYIMLFHDDDVHTTFQSRGDRTPKMSDIRQQLDRLVDRDPVRGWLSRCATASTPADLGPALDAVMRSSKGTKGARTPASGPSKRDAAAVEPAPLIVAYTLLLPFLWGVLAIALMLLLASALPHIRSPPGAALACLTLLGGALRLFSAVEGPGDLFNSLSGMFADRDPTHFGMYGMGIPSLLWGLEDLGLSVTDGLRIVCSQLAGIITIPLLYGLARSLKRSHLEATAAAAMMALVPLHVQFSALVHRYVLLVMLVVAACLFTVHFLEGRPPRRGWSGIAAFAALTLAMLGRPEAIAVGPLVISVTLVVNPLCPSAKRRAVGLTVLTALVALYPATISVHEALQAMPEVYVSGARPIFDPAYSTWFNPSLSPRAWMILSAMGVVLAAARDRRYIAWLTTAGLGWLWLTTTHPTDSHSVIYARHQLGAMPFLVLLAASGLTHLARRVSPGMAAGLSVFAMLGAVTPLTTVVKPTALSQEYAFMEEALAQIPKGCAVVAFETDKDTTLRRPIGLGLEHGLPRASWVNRIPDKGCVAVLHTAACSAIPEPESAQRRKRLCTRPDPTAYETILERRLNPHPSERVVFAEGDRPVSVGLYLRP